MRSADRSIQYVLHCSTMYNAYFTLIRSHFRYKQREKRNTTSKHGENTPADPKWAPIHSYKGVVQRSIHSIRRTVVRSRLALIALCRRLSAPFDAPGARHSPWGRQVAMPALMVSDFPPVVGLSGVYWEDTLGSRTRTNRCGLLQPQECANLKCTLMGMGPEGIGKCWSCVYCFPAHLEPLSQPH